MEHVAGSIKIRWYILSRDLGIHKIKRVMTKKELRAMCDRIEKAVTKAVRRDVDVYLDSRKKTPTRVSLLGAGDLNELEIDDGPVNGLLSDIRIELWEES